MCVLFGPWGKLKKNKSQSHEKEYVVPETEYVFPGKEFYVASLPYQVNDSNPEQFLFSFDDNGIEPIALCIPGKGSTTELFL